MRTKKAFTLIELLVVIAIIALLLSILMPSLRKAKAIARKVICNTHLHNLGITCQVYKSDNDGYYPIAWWGSVTSKRRIYYESLIKDDKIEGAETVTGNDEWVVSAGSVRKSYSCPLFKRFLKDKREILGVGYSNIIKDHYPVGYGYNSHLSRYNDWDSSIGKPVASSGWSFAGRNPNSNTLVLLGSSSFYLNNRPQGRFFPIYEMPTMWANTNGIIAGMHSGGFSNSLWADMHTETRKADEYIRRDPSDPGHLLGKSLLDHKELKNRRDAGYGNSEPEGKIACAE